MPRRAIIAALAAAGLEVCAQQQAASPRVTVPEGLTYRATQRLHGGDLRGALADANAALARDSQYPGAYAVRASIRLALGDRPGALTDMNRAIELAPDERGVELVHASRANLLWLEGRTPEAALDVKRALELNPTFPPALQMRARLRADAGDLDGARGDLDAVIAASPKTIGAYAERAAVHLLAGRLQESISDYKTSMWSLPNDAGALAGHGIVRGLLGETEAAIADLGRARALNPASVQDRGPAAASPAALLAQYRDLNPGDARAQLMGGVLRLLNNDISTGLRMVEDAVRLEPSLEPDARLVRARVDARK